MYELPYKSFFETLKSTASHYSERIANSHTKKGPFLSLTYANLYERVLIVAC